MNHSGKTRAIDFLFDSDLLAEGRVTGDVDAIATRPQTASVRGVGRPLHARPLVLRPPRTELYAIVSDRVPANVLLQEEYAGLLLPRAFQFAAAPETQLYRDRNAGGTEHGELQLEDAVLLGDGHRLVQRLDLAHPTLGKVQLTPETVFRGRERIIAPRVALALPQRLIVGNLQPLV